MNRILSSKEVSAIMAKANRIAFWESILLPFIRQVTDDKLRDARALSIYRRIEPHGA